MCLNKQTKENWLFLNDGDHSPTMNMAIDELLLQEVDRLKTPLLRIYGWDRPSVSIGYIQKYSAAPEKGYFIVRRPTGGGVVFHDIDQTYTVIVPSGHWIEKLNRLESYHIFHRVVIKTLAEMGINSSLVEFETESVDRATMSCFKTPTRYDVVIKNTDKLKSGKVAGAAQRRTKYGILHQGSIVIPEINKKQKELIENFLLSFKNEFNISYVNYILPDNILEAAEHLAYKKYETEEWNMFRKLPKKDS